MVASRPRVSPVGEMGGFFCWVGLGRDKGIAMKTLRRIESLYGTGRLWQGEQDGGKVEYTLEIWQEYLDETTPGMLSGNGEITLASPIAALDITMGNIDNLQLELNDGRCVSIVPGSASSLTSRIGFVTSGSLT